jgi:hypothetical protein
MFSKPLSHFLIGPGPFKRMGIQLIVLWPSGVDVVDQFLAAVPRAALQVTVTEGVIKQFRLIEPGGMHRGEAGPPPRVAIEVVGGSSGGMTGVTVLNQKHTTQVAVMRPKLLQRLEVMLSIFTCWTGGLHATAVHDQKQQHIDGAVASIFKLLLLDRAGDSPPDGGAFKRLQIGLPSSTQTIQKPLCTRR